MADEMYFSNDERALLRGKRRIPRTDTCRPCLVYIEGDDQGLEGVVLDVTPYGMMVRMLDTLAVGTIVKVQLMRDDNFRDTLGAPKEAEVVRHDPASPSGFADHGLRLVVRKIPRNESSPVNIAQRPVSGAREKPRMHSIDFTVGGGRRGRGGS